MELHADNFSSEKVVIMAGAGISVDSGLPLGEDLTKLILDLCCGIDVRKRIFKLWADCNDVVKRLGSSYNIPLPRLEIICNCINEIDMALSRKPILSGFNSFLSNKIKPGKNHKYLAQLLHSGSNIITTNFDLQIEKAYETLFNKKLLLDDSFPIPVYKSRNSSIYHLHGTCDDIVNLGATISKVRTGFSQEIENVLTNLLNECKLFVSVGYSASDSFDINPFFRELKLEPKKRTIQYIDHKLKESSKLDIPKGLDDLKQPFSHSFASTEDTTIFLDSLCSNLRIQDCELPNENQMGNESIFKWNEEFVNSFCSSYSKDDILINLATLRYHIGFDPEKIYPNSVEKLKFVLPRIREIRKKNESGRVFEYIIEAIKHQDYHRHKKIFFRLVIKNKPKIISKKYMNKLSKNCNYYLHKYNDGYKNVKEKDKKKIELLQNLLNEFSVYKYGQYKFISFFGQVLRFRYVFEARFKNTEDSKSQIKDLATNLDISYIGGVIPALREYSLQQFYLYCHRGDAKFFVKANEILNLSIEIATLSGFKWQTKYLNERRKWYEKNAKFKKI